MITFFSVAKGFSFVAPYLLDYDNAPMDPKPSLQEVTEYNLKVMNHAIKQTIDRSSSHSMIVL